ncbi:hypothetical protein EON83_11220 [bacterium]|nr:MAG: hypothetical protein EON83_11220 [bacterium]
MNFSRLGLMPSLLALSVTQQHFGAAQHSRRESAPSLSDPETTTANYDHRGSYSFGGGGGRRTRRVKASNPASHHHARFKKREKRRAQKARLCR